MVDIPERAEPVKVGFAAAGREAWSTASPTPLPARGGKIGADAQTCRALADRRPQIAVDAVCIENIARYKRPKAYVVLEALPKNNYGKVLKTELRELLRAGATRARAPS